MESDTSPGLICYRAHGIFYLYSLRSAEHFANNSLICHLFYLSISGLLTPHISGGANDATPVTQAAPGMGAQGHVGMSDSCPGAGPGHCLYQVALWVKGNYKKEQNYI